MQRSLFNKIKTSLWIIPSFIVLINGLGFIYIGHRMSKTKWILEGVVYEFPWVFGILTILNQPTSVLAFSIGILMLIVSVVRSIMVNRQYQELLDIEYEEAQFIESGTIDADSQIQEGEFTQKTVEAEVPNEQKTNEKPRHNPYDLSGIDKKYDGVVVFNQYRDEINDLRNEFNQKNSHVKELVEKRFSMSGLTYDRFMSIINDSEDLFNTQADYALDMINLAPEYTKKIDEELKKKINILKSIIKKNDELRDELIINMTDNTGSDVEMNNLFEDMENLTDSIKDYE
ncbi:MAG: hypothetical protein IJP12_03255 [Methanobrevibacter sp.]|nr:hypothetical protein [Methanobrevibacter sp.]